MRSCCPISAIESAPFATSEKFDRVNSQGRADRNVNERNDCDDGSEGLDPTRVFTKAVTNHQRQKTNHKKQDQERNCAYFTGPRGNSLTAGGVKFTTHH